MSGIGSPTVVEGQRPLERALGVLLCCSAALVEAVVLACANTTPAHASTIARAMVRTRTILLLMRAPPLVEKLRGTLVPLKVSGPLVPILLIASAIPLATTTVRAMVATNRMVRFIKRSPFAFPYPTTSFGWLRPNDPSFFPKSRSRSRRGLFPPQLLLLVY